MVSSFPRAELGLQRSKTLCKARLRPSQYERRVHRQKKSSVGDFWHCPDPLRAQVPESPVFTEQALLETAFSVETRPFSPCQTLPENANYKRSAYRQNQNTHLRCASMPPNAPNITCDRTRAPRFFSMCFSMSHRLCFCTMASRLPSLFSSCFTRTKLRQANCTDAHKILRQAGLRLIVPLDRGSWIMA